jgi:phage-related protein
VGNNTVEVVVRVNDQSGGGLRNFRAGMGRTERDAGGFGDRAGKAFSSKLGEGLRAAVSASSIGQIRARFQQLSSLASAISGGIVSALRGVGTGLAALAVAGSVIGGVVGLAGALQQLAGIGLALPGALGAAAGAIAALKVGLSGVGGALKAAFAPKTGGGGGGGGGGGNAAATQIANAKAIREAQDRITTSAHAVTQAQHGVEAAARGVAAAERAVADAEHSAQQASNAYRDALDRQKAAQADVSRAYAEATRELEDLNDAAVDAALGQEDAAISLQRAQENLLAVQKDVHSTALDQQEADLKVREAQQRLAESTESNARAQTDANDANAKGVEGSDRVTAAQQALIDANHGVEDAAYAMAQAQQGVADAQQGVRDANDQLAESQYQLTRAQAEAKQAIQDLADTMATQADKAAGAAGGANAYAAALAKLSPNARAFVEAVKALGPEWDKVKNAVQDRLFAGLAVDVRDLAGKYFPVLKTQLADIAGGFNGMAREGVKALLAPSAVSAVNAVLHDTSVTVGNMRPALADVITGFLGMSRIGSSFLPQIGLEVSAVAAKFKTWVADNPAKIQSMIAGAIKGFKDVAAIAGNVGSVIHSVFSGLALGNGGGFLASLRETTAALAEFMKTAAAQDGLRALGEMMAAAGGAMRDILLAALQALAPVIVALSPFIQELAREFGEHMVGVIHILAPLLLGLANTLSAHPALFLGIAKAVGIAALAFNPLMFVAGLALKALLGFLALKALDGVLGRLGLAGGVFERVLRALISPMALIRELLPLLERGVMMLGRAFLTAMGPVGWLITAFTLLYSSSAPFRDAINGLLGALMQVAGQLIQALMPAFQQIMAAVQPLIGALVGDGNGGGLGGALAAIALALVPVVEALIPVISAIADALIPIIVLLAQLFADIVSVVLPPLVDILTNVVVPAITLVAQIISTVLVWVIQNVLVPVIRFAADVIKNAVKVIGDDWNWLKNAWNVVANAIAIGWNWLVDRIRDAVNWIKGFLGGIWDGLVNGAKIAVNSVIQGINGLIRGINIAINGLNAINPFGQIGQVGYIPYLAKGGITGGLAMVGEQGRELVKLPQGSTVIPHGTTENMLAGSQGSGGGVQRIELAVAPGATGGLADLIMQMVRTGQLQLRTA